MVDVIVCVTFKQTLDALVVVMVGCTVCSWFVYVLTFVRSLALVSSHLLLIVVLQEGFDLLIESWVALLNDFDNAKRRLKAAEAQKIAKFFSEYAFLCLAVGRKLVAVDSCDPFCCLLLWLSMPPWFVACLCCCFVP